MAHEQVIPAVEPGQVQSIFTPVNLILACLAIYVIWSRLRPAPPPVLTAPEPLVFKTFTPKTLKPFNGTDDERVLMGVDGTVFDVTSGKSFYGPGGPYSNFAGRDASRGLAKNSFDEDMLTDVDKKIDLLEDLTEEERGSLRDWKGHFEGKYLVVGKLVNEGEE
ncbi:cytochrome b5-like heme/steroid binding domain-containing protein [Geopyxis carbonaria]|nr:cytochrome b5-like heme/steroid binding domain-containing protein [Geopyxis carbonaria]